MNREACCDEDAIAAQKPKREASGYSREASVANSACTDQADTSVGATGHELNAEFAGNASWRHSGSFTLKPLKCQSKHGRTTERAMKLPSLRRRLSSFRKFPDGVREARQQEGTKSMQVDEGKLEDRESRKEIEHSRQALCRTMKLDARIPSLAGFLSSPFLTPTFSLIHPDLVVLTRIW